MHTSPSGNRYVGITKQKPEHRWGKGKNYKQNSYFTSAIEKYGWDNFKHEVLYEVSSLEEAKALEIETIAKYHSDEREFGYNISKGGDPCNMGLGEEGRKQNRRNYEREYFSNPENRDRRRAWEREHSKTQEFKNKRNAYNKTDARRQHRAEYMRKYRETHKERMAEISRKAYLKRTGQLEGEQCTS
jgi:hypothetical protein